MQLAVYHDCAASKTYTQSISTENLLERLKALVSKANRKGLDALDPSRNRLIRIGMEIDAHGRVVKSGYGVLELSWQSQNHHDWAGKIEAETALIRERIEMRHKTKLRFLIYAGCAGLLEPKPRSRSYVIDANCATKLEAILKDLQRQSRRDLASALKSTLIVAASIDHLEKLAALYKSHTVDARSNFICIAAPKSPLEHFAEQHGFRSIEPQLDERETTATHGNAPLTRAALYPVAFEEGNVASWIAATDLTTEEIAIAWRLAAILHAHNLEGRDKITLLLPKEWSAASQWTKQNFERSLQMRLVVDEKIKLPNYRAPKDPHQDRLFLAIQVKGLTGPESKTLTLLRNKGYPLAVLTFPSETVLSRYVQFVHYIVFGLAWLKDLNFTKGIGAPPSKAPTTTATKWRGGITLKHNMPAKAAQTAPEIYASLINQAQPSYAELGYDGDTVYDLRGKAVKAALQRGAEALFRKRLKIPAGVCESYAITMLPGTFFTLITGERAQPACMPAAGAIITMKDQERSTLAALDEFFRQAVKHVTL